MKADRRTDPIEKHDIDGESYRVLFLSANNRDYHAAGFLLEPVGFCVHACQSLHELLSEYDLGAGALLISEETLSGEDAVLLKEKLQRQEPWSDVPLVIITRVGERSQQLQHLEVLGNVTLLERPVRALHLGSVLRSALRARQRQYASRREIRNRDQFLAMLGHETS